MTIGDAARAVLAARDAELEVGRLRGRLAEYRTQIDRAEQDVALGRRYWARRWFADHFRKPPAGSVAGALVSVITPVYETDPKHLRACLDSVAAQTHRNWEHVLVDDGSTNSRVIDELRRAASTDPRRRVIRHDRNGGIVAASTTALGAATGTYVALLDHDDVLLPTALERMVAALEAAPAACFGYSDNAVLRGDGRLVEPFYKPDFSPERLRNQNYILHLVVARRQAVLDAGGFRPGFDGAQDHDLLLRLSERGEVVHVPELLALWREAATSVAADPNAKPYAYEAGVRAVQEHCDRIGITATVEAGPAAGLYRLRRPAPDRHVTVIVPTRGTSAAVWGVDRVLVVEAVRSVIERSTHQRLDVVVVADADTSADAVSGLRAIGGGGRVTVVEYDRPFNFSDKCNAGAEHATGDLLLFLNDDTELIEPESIAEMAALLEQPDVGVVGAKLLFADGTIQHAGHVYPGLCTHALVGYPGDTAGPYRMAIVERECSGVTAAAAMISADRFREIGGFDVKLPRNFNDVDLSLRLRRAGDRIVWTPHAAWYHFESATRDPTTSDDERDLVIARWQAEIEHDPYFNPNLAPHRSDWLERPGRSGAPPFYRDARGRRRFS